MTFQAVNTVPTNADMFQVAYRPETANPKTHPYAAMKLGNPLVWFAVEVEAQTYVAARNSGLDHDAALELVQ